jgi:electron transport complex protein RnfD
VYLGVYLTLVRVWGGAPFGGALGTGDMLYCMFSGGTLAVAFLLAREPVTGPKSKRGMFITAIALALLSFYFRYTLATGMGAVAALVVVNTFTPLLRAVEERMYERGTIIHHKLVISIERSEQ